MVLEKNGYISEHIWFQINMDIRVGILTVSDTCSSGDAVDSSGINSNLQSFFGDLKDLGF